MGQVVVNTTPFLGTVYTIPPIPISGLITVAGAAKASVSGAEVAVALDVISSLSRLLPFLPSLPALPYVNGSLVGGFLGFNAAIANTVVPLATKSTKGGFPMIVEGRVEFNLFVTKSAQDSITGVFDPIGMLYPAFVMLNPVHGKLITI